jgi:hypothetical protein
MPEPFASLSAILASWIDANRFSVIVAGGMFMLALLVAFNVGFLARAGREARALRAAFDRLDARLAGADAARRSKSDERRRILASLADGLEARPARRD